MERPRMQRTYPGRRGKAGRAGRAWFPPPAGRGERRGLFSPSSSSGGASLEDPDARPPERKPRKRRRPPRRRDPKENLQPPSPLRRNVTLRRGRRPPPPLLCGTPQTPRKAPLEGPGPWDALRHGHLHHDALPELSLLPLSAKDHEDHHGHGERHPHAAALSALPKEEEASLGTRTGPPDLRASLYQATETHNHLWSEEEASPRPWEDPTAHPPRQNPDIMQSPDLRSRIKASSRQWEDPTAHPPRQNPDIMQSPDLRSRIKASSRHREDQSDVWSEVKVSPRQWEDPTAHPPRQNPDILQLPDLRSKAKASSRHREDQSDVWSEGKVSPRQWEDSTAHPPRQNPDIPQPPDLQSKVKVSSRHREDQSDIWSEGKVSSRQWEDSTAHPPRQNPDILETRNDIWSKVKASSRHREDQSEIWSEEEASPRQWEDQSDIWSEGKASPRQWEDQSDVWSEGKVSPRQWEDSTAHPPRQNPDILQPPRHREDQSDVWSEEEASSRHREDQNDIWSEEKASSRPQEDHSDVWSEEKASPRHREDQSEGKVSSRHREDHSDIWREEEASLRHREDPLAHPMSLRHSTEPLNDIWSEEKVSSRQREGSTTNLPSRHLSTKPLNDTGSKKKVSSRPREDQNESPSLSQDSPVQDQTTAGSPKAETPASKGAFQLQARFSGGKLALSVPRDRAPLSQKRRRMKETWTELGNAHSEELGEGGIDGKSPLLQPVVLLDHQAVPNWLTSQSSQKRGAEDPFRTNRPAAPVCNPGTTGRKACISGFSSKRWGRQKKPKERRRKKNRVERSPTNGVDGTGDDNHLGSSFLSPENSFQNSALWRRLRATFSFHKKKKILSPESFSGSIVGADGSFRHRGDDTPQTPFTQKLGYSICPSSSMVLLSAFSSSQLMPTDEEKVYGECQQKGPVSFEECVPVGTMRTCRKIGEGVFGEVFRAEGERGAVALKIIPIEGAERVNGEPQKTFGEILPEIIISKELSLLAEDDEEPNQASGFIRLHSVHCVRGAYPEPLLDAWDEFHRLRTSENDRPDFFGERQLFMVLEFEDGGTDLENMRQRKLGSVAAAKSVLQQVAASLAVAEEALCFEHRDLHWGNVLIKNTDRKEVSVRLKGETLTFPTHGILVSIIDYTFSRLERDGLTVYCDLSTDEEVFQGRGDYQFDVYRRMREENGNEWADYFPHSNVLWLHYLVEKLLTEVTYKRKPTTGALKALQKELKGFSAEVLGFRSAGDLLKGSPFFR
nr:PREDICTED: serine/threonine-protein kinase haspin [Anolis carolinensis]|eukprot:XP_008123868.2 PREDICTED: serine/threonine-protein kinase haspin [Anolis carolinensis]